MSTSPKTSTTSWLKKPEGDAKIPAGTFGYINARIRQRAYDLVIREFKKSGISQAVFARRWGKAPEVVSRFLARPGNWELNTWTEALFAINGAIPTFATAHVDEPMISLSRRDPVAKSSTDKLNLMPLPPIAMAA